MEPGYSKENLVEASKELTFPSRHYTVGPRSISKKEILVQLKIQYPNFF